MLSDIQENILFPQMEKIQANSSWSSYSAEVDVRPGPLTCHAHVETLGFGGVGEPSQAGLHVRKIMHGEGMFSFHCPRFT